MAKLINILLISFFGAIFISMLAKPFKILFQLIKKKKPKPESGGKKESRTFSVAVAVIGAVLAIF